MSNKWFQHPFGNVNGIEIIETVMENQSGMRVKTSSYGATITAIEVPDRYGKIENVVCGFTNVDNYIQHPQYFGATIGPFAGRIENGELVMNDIMLTVPVNDGSHLLHGGDDGFHQYIWKVEVIADKDSISTIYSLHYKGYYPGHIEAEVKFTLLNDNTLEVQYSATSSENTFINLTNHSYFNLSGNLKETIHKHNLKVPANYIMPLSSEGLPLSEYKDIRKTVFDLGQGAMLEEILNPSRVHEADVFFLEQLTIAQGGLDHAYILNENVITLSHDQSGRILNIYTNDKAVVIYSGNKIGSGYNFSNAAASNHLGVCLEEQNVPNSIKYPHLPSSFKVAGEQYLKKTVYQFAIME